MSNVLQVLRKQLKRQRAALSVGEQKQHSALAIKRLQHSNVFRSAKNIAIYLPVRGEMDPTRLTHSGRRSQNFYLPVLSLYKPHGLVFVRWDKTTRFRQNRFRIPEPLIKRNQLKSPRQMDLVVMPLLAFDEQGSRLGMGGGYYDRSFAFKKTAGRQKKPLLLGFAYQFQQISRLPRQTWDVPLDAIVTDTQLTIVNKH